MHQTDSHKNEDKAGNQPGLPANGPDPRNDEALYTEIYVLACFVTTYFSFVRRARVILHLVDLPQQCQRGFTIVARVARGLHLYEAVALFILLC